MPARPSASAVAASFREQRLERMRVSPGGRFALAMKSLASQGLAGSGLLSQSGFSLGNAYGQDTEELQDVYRQVPWLGAGINLLARVSADVRLTLWDRNPDDPDAQEILDEFNPLWRFLHTVRVNEAGISRTLAAKYDAINMSLTGESFWLLHDRNGNPVQPLTNDVDSLVEIPDHYVPVRGDLVSAVREKGTGRIVAWNVASSSGRSRRQYPAGSVILHMEIPDHSRPGRGLGLIQQAWGPASQTHLASRYNSTWLRNFGDPGGVLSYDGWLSDDQYARVQQQKADTLDNPDRVGETFLAEGGIKYESSKAKPRDMAFETLINAGRIDMSALMGTSEGVLGGKDMTYATFVGHFRTFMFLRLEPYLQSIADTLNHSFIPRVRDLTLSRYRVAFDSADLRRKMEDAEQQGKQLEALIGAGVRPNEALSRVEFDAEPIEIDGDIPFAKRTMIPMPALVLTEASRAIKAMRDAGLEDEDIVRQMDRLGLPGVTKLREREVPPQLQPGADGEPPKPKRRRDDPLDDEDDTLDADAVGSDRQTNTTTRAAPDGATAPTGSDNRSTAVGAARVASSLVERAPSRSTLTRKWNEREQRIRPQRQKLWRAIKKTFNRARAQQLEALRVFASSGKRPERGIIESDTVAMPTAHCLRFYEAWMADVSEASALERMSPGIFDREVVACDSVRHVRVDHRPRQERWVEQHEHLRKHGLERLRCAALAYRAGVSSEEIERLLIIGSDRFRNALAEDISRYSLETFRKTAKIAGEEVGVSIIDTTSADVLDAFARASVKVAEGNLSALSASLKRNILEVLATGPTDGSLQDRIEAVLDELQAATRKAFASHAHRAQTIAATETAKADNLASFKTAKKAFKDDLIKGLRWITSGRGPAPLGTVRPSHYALEQSGEIVEPGERFANGLRHPLDPQGEASEVVNCQCALSYVFKNED